MAAAVLKMLSRWIEEQLDSEARPELRQLIAIAVESVLVDALPNQRPRAILENAPAEVHNLLYINALPASIAMKPLSRLSRESLQQMQLQEDPRDMAFGSILDTSTLMGMLDDEGLDVLQRSRAQGGVNETSQTNGMFGQCLPTEFLTPCCLQPGLISMHCCRHIVRYKRAGGIGAAQYRARPPCGWDKHS